MEGVFYVHLRRAAELTAQLMQLGKCRTVASPYKRKSKLTIMSIKGETKDARQSKWTVSTKASEFCADIQYCPTGCKSFTMYCF